MSDQVPGFGARLRAGWLEIAEPPVDGGVNLRVRFDSLRPESQAASDDDDVVLVVIPPGTHDELSGTWSLTAESIDAVYSGPLTASMPVEMVEITGGLLALLDAIAE